MNGTEPARSDSGLMWSVRWAACGVCRTPLPLSISDDDAHVCLSCGAPWEAWSFPAAQREYHVQTGDRLLDDSESSCFYHPAKRAEYVCDGCGRFLCALCDLEIGAEHLCPACVSKGVGEASPTSTLNHAYRFDSIALQLALLGVLCMFVCLPVFFFTIPIVLYLTFARWKNPGGLVTRNRWRFLAATAISILPVMFTFLGLAVNIMRSVWEF